MKRKISILFYTITSSALCIVLYFVLMAGKKLEPVINIATNVPIHKSLTSGISATISGSLSIFILQLIIIIITARLCGFLFRKINQPAVMGEIIAGILLGPSLLGTIAPDFSAFLFPVASLGNIKILSQIGLILFMFVVGMELDWEVLKSKAADAFSISHASIIFPFSAGLILSYFLYEPYAPKNIPFYAFALFMGIALSITAFPVLARILKERNMSNTRMGIIALTSAAAGDITAWCILAIIIAVAKAGSVGNSFYTFIFATLYVLVMLLLIKPLLCWLTSKKQEQQSMSQSTLAFLFLVLLASAWICEIIGIHALFGAFMAGVIMPLDWDFRNIVINKIEDVALVLLLPLFFVATGLQTQIGLLNDTTLWMWCGLIIIVAIAGKFGGSAIAARLTGASLKDSLSIGALMNTRGLMELVVLNIGYELGILSAQIFAMMVIMAIVTTLLTTPALKLIERMK
jgi:Kef-type K+ transport system membrane component KefB